MYTANLYKHLEDNGIEYDSEVVIQRDVYLDGKNVCRVNGILVTVSILHKLGIQLINIHGQHDSASLFDENYHLDFLDAFADHGQLIHDYRVKYHAVQDLRREIQRMSMDEGEKLRRMETLRYQIDEIEKAELEALQIEITGREPQTPEEEALENTQEQEPEGEPEENQPEWMNYPIDPVTGYRIDPETGRRYDADSGFSVDGGESVVNPSIPVNPNIQ